jgi:hypothetical protein
MKENALPPPLLTWLMDNPYLVKFIRIDASPDILDPERFAQRVAGIEMGRQTQVVHLNHFIDTTLKVLLDCLSFPGSMPKPGSEASPKLMWLYHFYMVLQDESFHMRRTDLANSIAYTQKLIDFLRDPAILPPDLDVGVEEHEFQKAMLDGSMASFVLTEYLKVVQADLRDLHPMVYKVPQFQSLLVQILDRVRLQIDMVTFYIPPTESDQHFEEWLFNPSLPLADELTIFFENFGTRKEFTNRACELFGKLQTVFSFVDSIGLSCGLIMFFRAVFGRAYGDNPAFFFPNKPSNLALVRDFLPVESLEISPEFLPPHEPEAPVYSVFSGLRLFDRAASHLLFAFYFTNPIDALFEVHEAVHILEQFAASQSPEGGTRILPFETAFGLFIAAVLVNDLPNFEEFAAFVVDFAPEKCLCQDLLFAYSTAHAATKYCQTLRETYADRLGG